MRFGLVFLAVIAATAACRPSTAERTSEPEADAGLMSLYSPYVLQMSAELPFQRISMKDVGMSVDPSHREQVYEEVAMSLSVALAQDPEIPMSSEVLYSEEVKDPASHLACGMAQIYVDVWAPRGTERWGYSLWSGCSEEDRFARHEVNRRDAQDVDALTRSIAHSLRHAVATRCFVREC
ncbi:MAG: hypothetical protein AAFZ18_05305 [Myxococcota bacterium]